METTTYTNCPLCGRHCPIEATSCERGHSLVEKLNSGEPVDIESIRKKPRDGEGSRDHDGKHHRHHHGEHGEHNPHGKRHDHHRSNPDEHEMTK